MLRTIGPQIAVFDTVVLAGRNRLIQHFEASFPVIGVNRCEQVLIGKRFTRLSAEITCANVGCFEFELRNMQFQRPQMTGAQRGLQQAFAFGQIGKNRAGLVLATPAPDRGSDDADECRRVERALDEADIAKDFRQPRGCGITLRTTAAVCQNDER